MKTRRLTLMAAAIAAPLMLAAAAHPTPKVMLVEHADAIRNSLADAQRFFLRKVTIGQADLARIRKSVDFTPDDREFDFYIGKRSDGKDVGVVLFPQANTTHGPLEVALAMAPDGTIRKVTVTMATVETKPWVEEAVRSGFLERFEGMSAGGNPAATLEPLKGKVGKMPYYEAEVTAAAVKRGLALYSVLYR